MKVKSSGKWFQTRPLLIALLFLFPPLGILGILQRSTKAWKKIIYILSAVVMSIIILVMILAIAFPINRFENGNDLLRQGNLEAAIKEFEKINNDDPKFGEAQLLIKEANRKLKELQVIKKNLEAKKLTAFIAFQKVWADSIVKSESTHSNKHLVGSILKLPDSILFEYSVGVTTKGFAPNIANDTVLYRKSFEKSLSEKFGSEFDTSKVFISCIPNRTVDYEKVLFKEKERYARDQKIKGQFSAWDGSHIGVKKYIKENMKDPSSFNHIETTYLDKGKYILVTMRFRGRNSFGAIVINSVVAKVDLAGNIISIQS